MEDINTLNKDMKEAFKKFTEEIVEVATNIRDGLKENIMGEKNNRICLLTVLDSCLAKLLL